MLSGCERTSVEDIYNMYSTEETGTEQSVEDKIIYDGLNIKYLLPDDVRIVDRSEKAELVNMHGKIGIEIIDVALGDSYYDMENYTDCEEIVYENIEKLQKKEGGFNHDFDDDGKVVSKYTNVDNGFIFIKMRLTNDSSETVEFSMGNIELYNMDEEHDYITDFRSIEDDLIDKQQTDGARRLYYEFKPNETADILRIYVYQKEQILSYKTISTASLLTYESFDIVL